MKVPTFNINGSIYHFIAPMAFDVPRKTSVSFRGSTTPILDSILVIKLILYSKCTNSGFLMYS